MNYELLVDRSKFAAKNLCSVNLKRACNNETSQVNK